MKTGTFWLSLAISIGIGVPAGILSPHLAYLIFIYAAIATIIIFFALDFFPERRGEQLSPKLKRFLFAPLFLMICGFSAGLTGCATIGLSTPQSFDESLAEAYGVHTAVVSAAAAALTAGSITVAEAKAVETQAESSRALLDAARVAEVAGATAQPQEAQNDLTLAETALTALQTYLNAQTKPATAGGS